MAHYYRLSFPWFLGALLMKVEIEEVGGKSGWVVWLDACAVNFKTRAEAEAFVERLQARLSAPHPLPTNCRELLSELS